MSVTQRHFEPRPRTLAGLRLAAAAGGVVFLAGLFIAPQRVWGGFLMGFVFLTSLALAGPVFVAFLNMAGARWSAALQRVPEAMGTALPVAGAAGLVLLFGTHSLYEWSHESVVEHDPILAGKAAWLNTTGFAVRMVAIFAIWILLSRRLLATSRSFEEGGGGKARAQRSVVWSAVFIATVAITWSVAAMDWLMSLEPHWFSTMFALMHFGSVAVIGVSAGVIVVLMLERQGALAGVLRTEHLHDIGKLMFALTLFWAYCWYCQYMLIWYTDIPEETTHYALRKEGPWWLLVQAVLVLKWGVPFCALMARRACRSRRVLAQVAATVLVGSALDLYVQVGPPLMGPDPVLGLWEIGPVVGAVALFFLITLRALSRGSAVPQNHPYLEDSLTYHTP